MNNNKIRKANTRHLRFFSLCNAIKQMKITSSVYFIINITQKLLIIHLLQTHLQNTIEKNIIRAKAKDYK